MAVFADAARVVRLIPPVFIGSIIVNGFCM